MLIIISVLLSLLIATGCSSDKKPNDIQEIEIEKASRGTVPTVDVTNRTLEYFYYIPSDSVGVLPKPVLIIVPGLDGSGKPFVLGRWRKFAQASGFAIVSPTFRYNEKDYKIGKSYQFPAVWSGQAMLDILDSVDKTHPLDKYSLYLFGHSAGAQFVHRFALLNPERCKAVAAHAPGGVTMPEKWVPVNFFITDGQNDAGRLERARNFTVSCKTLNISADLKEYPGVGHELCSDAIQKSFEFFIRVKSQK